MKKILTLISAALLSSGIANAQNDAASDSTGLPGDNLDLFGVLDLFKAASTMEDFEKALNSESNQVNNLDLDQDGNVDYIKVIDRADSGVHAITLQVDITDKEAQDVAVIELEKTGDASADLQIVGDEDLYGEDYIVEAAEAESTNNEGKFTSGFMQSKVVVVNVWVWPCVRHVYAPGYVVWVSPWRYHVYPPYFRPWRPVAWRVHHARVVRYHVHYRRVHAHRVVRAHRVAHRHRVASAHYRANHPNHHRGPAHNNTRGKQGGPHKGPAKGPAKGPKGGGKPGPKGGGGRRR